MTEAYEFLRRMDSDVPTELDSRKKYACSIWEKKGELLVGAVEVGLEGRFVEEMQNDGFIRLHSGLIFGEDVQELRVYCRYHSKDDVMKKIQDFFIGSC